jgi:GntR family phosphonate transport system transcriptional regulator
VTLTKRPGAALWTQVRDILRREIAEREYLPGTRFPSEEKLTIRFGVHRHTVRRALDALRDAGLIRKEQGRGAFVNEDALPYLMGRRTRFGDNMSRNLKPSVSRLLASHVEAAGELAASRLGLAAGRHRVTVLETVGWAGEKPMFVSTQYMPYHVFPRLEEIFAREGSLTRTYRHFGVCDYIRRESRVFARMPSAGDARLLGQPRTSPLLVVEYVNADLKGQPIEFGITRFAGERMHVVVDCATADPLEEAVAARLEAVGAAVSPGFSGVPGVPGVRGPRRI